MFSSEIHVLRSDQFSILYKYSLQFRSIHGFIDLLKYLDRGTEGKKKRRVNILGGLILFIRMFFSILIYKDKNTNLINRFLKFH